MQKTTELSKIEKLLSERVKREYQEGYNHISTWVSSVQQEVREIDQNPPEGKISIDLVKENIDFERASFLQDETDIAFVSDDGVIAKRQIENLKNVWKFDYTDTGRREMNDRIIIDNGYYGIAVEIQDIYDEDENQPMSVLVNPDACIPDPRCFTGSNMRFFGYSRKVPSWKLKSDMFNLRGMSIEEIKEDGNQRISDLARDPRSFIPSNEGACDLYEHYTIHEGKKVLTTWVNNREKLIRYVELAELTQAEQMNPLKTKFNIVFHRRKPHPYRWAGYRIKEEVGNAQDIITQLKNLEIAQARISTYGPDLFLTENLGVEAGKLQKLKEGGRIIPVNSIDNGSIRDHIFQQQYAGNNQFSQTTSQYLLDRVKRNLGYTDITMGVSPDGQQTKGEIQQLQANANKFISWVRSNYLQGEKEYAELWVRSYQENMPSKSKKLIALFDKGGMSRSLKKNEFIPDGKILIDIKSSTQEKIENKKSVMELMALLPQILPNMKSQGAVNNVLRVLVDKSSINGVEGEDIIPLSSDENLALSRVEMINNNVKVVSTPQPGEDLDTHINIYEKCIDTPAKKKILQEYKDARDRKAQVDLAMGMVNNQTSNIAMNQVSQQNNPNTSPTAAF